jgi:23S rRNA (uracil1939-C5)-methyltransferase
VTLVEGDPVSGHDLEANAHPYGNRVRVNRSSVEDFLRRRTFATDATLIVDPPRTGMSPEAVRAIVGARPKRIIYVSCDVATLARDARALVDADYAMNDISAVDLFPNTAHVESICAFEHTDRALTIS